MHTWRTEENVSPLGAGLRCVWDATQARQPEFRSPEPTSEVRTPLLGGVRQIGESSGKALVSQPGIHGSEKLERPSLKQGGGRGLNSRGGPLTSTRACAHHHHHIEKIRKLCRGWKDGLAVRSTDCSSFQIQLPATTHVVLVPLSDSSSRGSDASGFCRYRACV